MSRLLQQGSPLNRTAPAFPGIARLMRHPVEVYHIKEDNYLIIENFAGHSSLGMDNGTASGVQSAVRIPFLQNALHHGVSSSVPNGTASLLRAESFGKQSGLDESGHLQSTVKFDVQEQTKFHPLPLPHYQDGFISGIHCNSPSLMGTSFNSILPETIDSRQLERAGSNGRSLEQGGKYINSMPL